MTSEVQALAEQPRRFKLSKVGFLEFLAYSAITWLIGLVVYGVAFFLFMGIFVGIAASSAKATNTVAPMAYSVEETAPDSITEDAVKKAFSDLIKIV